MKQGLKIAGAVFVNAALMANQLLAALPPITFESPEFVPSQTVSGAGWDLVSGGAEITPAGQGVNGSQALRIPADAQQDPWLRRAVSWDAQQMTAFVDLQVKPAADPEGSLASFYANGTQIAFQVPQGSSVGEVWVYHGNDGDAGSSNPPQWIKTAGTFALSQDGLTAADFIRVTLRHDYQRDLWDLFIDGKLAAANLSFEGRGANLESLEFFGSRNADTLVDDVSAQIDNMLFADADKDGISDAWEIANGSNPNLYDRDDIKPGTSTSFLDLYMASLWAGGSINAQAPVVASVGIPPLTILGSHQPVGSLKGSLSVGADGSASYSVPIDLPKGTAGMEPKLNLGYSSNGGNGLLGLGWSLGGFQRITRGAASHAKDGFAGAVRFDSDDRFFFDGERLVCVAGAYGMENSEYRTEIDSFARIQLMGGNANTPGSWWQVQTKAGLTIELGKTTDAKVIVPGPNAPITWDVSKVLDTVGNYYSVTWAGELADSGWQLSNRRFGSVSYTGSTGMAPYCHVEFDYEDRPDTSFAYHPTGLRMDASKRLAGIVVKTGGFVNFTYRLGYETSHQSGRSLLKSIHKEMPGGWSTAPTVFNWAGLQPSQPRWAKSGGITLPLYNGNDWDGDQTPINSVVSTNGTTIRLDGDVSRAVPLTPAWQVSNGDYLEFELRGERLDRGAFLVIDTNTNWNSSNSSQFCVWVRPPDAGGSPMTTSREVAYPNDGNWQTYRIALQGHSTSSKNLLPGSYGYLALINYDNEHSNGVGWVEFRNVRVGAQQALDHNQVAPHEFPETSDLPRFTKGSSSRGLKMMDLDSDGLIDFADSRTADWTRVSGELLPNTSKLHGGIYRNTGGSFAGDASLRPGDRYPMTTTGDDGGWTNRHDLSPVPCDVNGDGRLDLFVTETRAGWDQTYTSIQRYKFLTRENGVWVEMPGYVAPFESRNNNSSGKFGGQKHLTLKNFMDVDGDGYPDLLIHTSPVGWLAAPNPATGLPASAKLVPENSQTVFLNKVHLGLGWVRNDALGTPSQLYRSDSSSLHDLGGRLLDVDGDSFPDFIESTVVAPSDFDKDWVDSRKVVKFIPSAATISGGWQTAQGGGFVDSLESWMPAKGYPGLWSLLEWPTAAPVDDHAPLVAYPDSESRSCGSFLIDFNGDGLMDVIRSYSRRFKSGSAFERSHSAWFNSGRETPSETGSRWLKDPSPYGDGYTLPISLVTKGLEDQPCSEFVDLNGDGLVDILFSKDSTKFAGPGAYRDAVGTDPFGGTNNGAFINTGTGWVQDTTWGLPPGIRLGKDGKEEAAAIVADVNGDGFPDVIGKILDGQQPELWLNQAKPEVLESVMDGYGSELAIEYHRLNDPSPTVGFGSRVYEKHEGALPTGQAMIIDSRLVVSRYSEPDGMGGRRYKSQRYGDLRYDRLNEASLGFGWIEAMDEMTGQVTRTETSRTFPFAGSPIYSETKVLLTQADIDTMPNSGTAGVPLIPGMKTLSIETATFDQQPPQAGVTGGTIRRPVQTVAVKQLFDLDGTLKVETVTSQPLANFDAYGFVTASTVTSLDGSSVTTSNTYYHDTSNGKWLLGRLSQSTVVKSGAGKPSITKTSSFTYKTYSGLLSAEFVQLGHPQMVMTLYTHDAFGNVTGTTISASGQSRTTTSTYDSQGRFVISESNQLGHTVSHSYDSQRALLESTTDINENTTSFTYDAFGTLILTHHPDGTKTGEVTGFASQASLPSSVASLVSNPIVYFRAKQTSGAPVAKVYLDAMGRELVAETTILRNANSTGASRYSKVYSVTQYDSWGRKSAVSEPFAAGETPLLTSITYDLLSRTIRTTHQDGTYDQILEHGAHIISGQPYTYSKTANRNGQVLERWEDQHGRLAQSKDPSGQTTIFSHDHEGRLLNVTIGGQLLLTNTWDLFGNRTSVTEANSGTSTSTFNGFGETVSTTNARGQTTTSTYDILGRPLTVTKPEGTYTIAYDGAPGAGLGQPWKTTGPDGYQETVAYDGYGRAIATTKTQFGETFSTSTTYDTLGRVAASTDAGGLTVVNEYDPTYSFALSTHIGPGVDGAGTLLWKAGTFDSKGRSVTQTLANGVTTGATYHPASGLLNTLVATHASGTLQDKSCEWSPIGNLTKREDHVSKRAESFTYDHLNRLTGSTVTAMPGATITTVPPPASYSYDIKGNLLTKAGATLTYGGPRPHAVTAATIKGENRAYAYDAAGNVTSDGKRTYEWASFGQLKSLDYLSAPAVQNFAGTQIFAASRVNNVFEFDAGGSRARQIKQRIAANDSRIVEETLYLGSYEREIHSTRADASATPVYTKTVHRHSLGGAVYTRSVTGSGMTVKLTTVLKDHLGSTDVLLTGTWSGSAFTGTTVEHQSFDPWGEHRAADTWSVYRQSASDAFRRSAQDHDRGYTGHEQLDDSGLIHMNGRIYDPELGRFLSPDPVVQIPEYSQDFNRYSYVLNNPLNATDPSGLSWISKAFSKKAAWLKENWRTVVAIVVGVILVATGFGAIAAGAILGASTAAATAFTVAGFSVTYGALLGGAIVGGIMGGLNAALHGGDAGDILRGMAVGAVQGAIASGVLHGMEEAATTFMEKAAHVAGHGVTGGVANVAMGGKFEDGFLSAAAGATASWMGAYKAFEGSGAFKLAGRTAMAGAVGGTVSVIGGGKFANGAWTASFQHLLNNEISFFEKQKSILLVGGEQANDPDYLEEFKLLQASARLAGVDVKMGFDVDDVKAAWAGGRYDEIIIYTHGHRDGRLLFYGPAAQGGKDILLGLKDVFRLDKGGVPRLVVVSCHNDRVVTKNVASEYASRGVTLRSFGRLDQAGELHRPLAIESLKNVFTKRALSGKGGGR